MKSLLIAGIALAAAGAVIVPQQAGALENCFVVTATADARNRDVSIERAEIGCTITSRAICAALRERRSLR